MKRYKRQPTIEIDINIIYMLLQNVAAAISNFTDKHGFIIDEGAYGDYLAFVDNVRVLLDMYEFDVKEPSKGPHQFKRVHGHYIQKFKSEYLWTATRKEISEGDVPEYLVLRISDHAQHFSKQGDAMIRKREKEFAEQYKLPQSKRIQRYKLVNVIVNGATYSSYDEALQAVEEIILSKLGEDGIDLEIYK